jgi:hypothetical protein
MLQSGWRLSTGGIVEPARLVRRVHGRVVGAGCLSKPGLLKEQKLKDFGKLARSRKKPTALAEAIGLPKQLTLLGTKPKMTQMVTILRDYQEKGGAQMPKQTIRVA